jgi:hypothetical protein
LFEKIYIFKVEMQVDVYRHLGQLVINVNVLQDIQVEIVNMLTCAMLKILVFVVHAPMIQIALKDLDVSVQLDIQAQDVKEVSIYSLK